ncbi:MAG: cyclic nucleotide-binding domain-containing protein [Agriterribacter sp.]
MKHEPLIRLLKQYENITPEEEGYVKRYFSCHSFKKGGIILPAGFPCNKLIFVNKGLLRAFYDDENGRQITRMIAWENRFLTNLASFQNLSDSVETFECIEDAEVLLITRHDLKMLFRDSASLHNVYIKLLEEYSIINLNRLHLLSIEDVASKMRVLKTDYAHLIGRVNDNILASFLFISRSAFARHKSVLFI